MTDEPLRQPHAQTGRGRDRDHDRSNRGTLGLVGAITVIAVVALVLLMLRGCDTGANSASSSSGAKEIVPVAGLSANPGIVSAWVAAGSDVSAALRIAGLEDSVVTDMGGGRYVISVPVGTEDSAIRILSGVEGVYDAGRVYEQRDK